MVCLPILIGFKDGPNPRILPAEKVTLMATVAEQIYSSILVDTSQIPLIQWEVLIVELNKISELDHQ